MNAGGGWRDVDTGDGATLLAPQGLESICSESMMGWRGVKLKSRHQVVHKMLVRAVLFESFAAPSVGKGVWVKVHSR